MIRFVKQVAKAVVRVFSPVSLHPVKIGLQTISDDPYHEGEEVVHH
ncbi:MAG: hypothetical protein OHK0012_02010 [Synechococcales cyanobacterium]